MTVKTAKNQSDQQTAQNQSDQQTAKNQSDQQTAENQLNQKFLLYNLKEGAQSNIKSPK